jgi:hypothetical protein
MAIEKRVAARLIALAAFILLLSAPVYALEYQGDHISTQGRITSISQEGDQYRISLNHGGYSYYVPMTVARSHNLHVGDRVRLGGVISNDAVNVDMIALPGEPSYLRDPAYRGVPFGSTGWLSGTIDSTNRHLGYLTIRDDASGNLYKIDVRHMTSHRPVNLWDARPGDHVTVNGSWERPDLFDARRVEF